MRLSRWRRKNNLPLNAIPPVWGDAQLIRCQLQGCYSPATWQVTAQINPVANTGKPLLSRIVDVLCQTDRKNYLVCDEHIDRVEAALKPICMLLEVRPYRQEVPNG